MKNSTFPRVSVVIPTYNREKWIARAIESALGQTFSNIEVIVVDDGSTDRSKERIQRYKGQVRYIWQAHAGVSVARNRGILEGRGEWIAFLDSDDEWIPTKLEAQMELADACPQIVMVVSNVYIEDGVNKVRLFDIREQILDSTAKQVRNRPLIAMCKINFFTSSFLIKKAALLQVGMFDQNMALSEDRDLACRIALVGAVGIVNEPLVHIISRGGEDISLSSEQEKDRRRGYMAGIVTYEKLLRSGDMTRAEVDFVRRCLSGDRFYLGVEEYKRGNRKNGLFIAWQSCGDCPSVRSLVRLAMFVIGGQCGIAVIQASRGGNGYLRTKKNAQTIEEKPRSLLQIWRRL